MLAIIITIFFYYLVFGQERNMINVQVRQKNERKQEKVLYRNSNALLIGNSHYSEWNGLLEVESDAPQIKAILRGRYDYTTKCIGFLN